MIEYYNPFEYEAASKFSPEQILDFYIEDFNYSRFIRSRRNIRLLGERGAGKTMTLLYNSGPVQNLKKSKDQNNNDLDIICVYIPCNTTLTHKREYELLDDFSAAIISEHFLVLSILYSIADTLSNVKNLLSKSDETQIIDEVEFIFDTKLPKSKNFFDSFKLLCDRQAVKAQYVINKRTVDAYYDNTFTFSSRVIPVVKSLKKVSKLKNTHFSLMFDDAHDLNEHQIKVLNSWIAFRDNTLFSFKVATAKVDKPRDITATGGTILEGHDFTAVDMEQPYQNKYSDFGKLGMQIVKKRLEKINIQKSPDEFFPININLKKDISDCDSRVRERAAKIYDSNESKKIADYVYKFTRAEYFRSRAAQANLPPYSGFEMLVHISTGVIRNLLEPCYWMFDKRMSSLRSVNKDPDTIIVDEIPASIQTEVLLERSKKKWEWIRDGLDKSVEGCSTTQAKQIFQLFDNLAIHFRERLLKHDSEPRAISFTISETKHNKYQEIKKLLHIARKAQILYTYSSSAKDAGRREEYYVPNRILWPERGLDPVGQHARVSIKCSVLWEAASKNKMIPIEINDNNKLVPRQTELFK